MDINAKKTDWTKINNSKQNLQLCTESLLHFDQMTLLEDKPCSDPVPKAHKAGVCDN